MEISVISHALTLVASTQGLSIGVSKLNFCSNQSSEQSAGILQISAMIFPLDAVAPPPVKSNRTRTLPRRLMKKRRRTRRRSSTGDDDNDDREEVFGFFGGDGGVFDGPFNNGGGGGGGGGWNFGGSGGANWEEYSSNSYNDPAFDFVYEVLSWIVLSNCLHFAFKKIVRIVADVFGDPAREKVPMRLAPVC